MRLFTVAFRAMSALGMRAIVLATLLTVASVATAGVERYNDPNPIPVPEGWSPEQVQAAIRRVLEEQDWVVVEEVTGRTHATLEARRRKVRVRADYDEKTVRFLFAGGEKLEHEMREGRLYVDSVYSGWLDDLTRYLASEFTPDADDEVLPPLIGAEPATTSTADPVIRLALRNERAQDVSYSGYNPTPYLIGLFDSSGKQLLHELKRKSFFHEYPPRPPQAVSPGAYSVRINCYGPGYPYSFSKVFDVPLTVRPGLEYVVDCLGHRPVDFRAQITPRALAGE